MKFNVALLQMAACGNDQQANMAKGMEFCRRAKAMGADLALFPEMWNIGYTGYTTDGFRSGFDPAHPKYEPLRKAWQQQAIARDGSTILAYQALAKELQMAIAVTYLQAWSGQPRNAVSIIDRFGNILMTYAKVHTCDFSFEEALMPGDEFSVCILPTTQGEVTLGAMICYDREFPESARILMLKGAEIILVPNACGLERYRIGQMYTRAFENMLGLAMTNYAAPDCNGHSIAVDGISFDQHGVHDMLLVEAGPEEGIFMACFDLDALRQYRSKEVWGNAFRKPKRYAELLSEEVQPLFFRKTAKR